MTFQHALGDASLLAEPVADVVNQISSSEGSRKRFHILEIAYSSPRGVGVYLALRKQ